MAEAYKYWAFISYSHQDRAWGDWLHKTLETYRVPKRLIGRESRDGQVPARLFPVFRDRDELPSSANLGDVLNESLRQSRYQIVICSPRSAASKWVNEEIKYFKSLGREDRVLCLIVDGEPNVFDVPGRDIEECFAPALRYRVDSQGQITDQPAEPIAADAREHADGKRGARIKLLSGLLGVGFDELFQRERQRRFWQRVQMGLVAAAFTALCVGAWQWFEGQRSAREREITIERLVESGRLELLAGQQARAAVYLNEAYKMGDDSVPVRFMLAQAMKPVEALTRVRVEHGGVAVYKSAFSPDGKRFALHVLVKGTGDQQAVAKIYDAASGEELMKLPDAPALPLQVIFLPDGKGLLMTGFPDDSRRGAPFTRIWNLESGSSLKLEGVNGLLGRPIDSSGKRVLIAQDSGLGIYETATGKLDRVLQLGQVIAASYSTDGAFLVIADGEGVVKLLSTTTGQVLKQFPEAKGQRVSAVLFTHDGQRLFALAGREDIPFLSGDLRIWDIASGVLKLSFAAEADLLNDLQFSRDGQRYLTVGVEGYKVWSTGRGVLMFSVPRTLSEYASAALSPDGSTLITADFQNKTAEAWDISSKRLVYTLDLHSDGISSAVFDEAGERLLLASRDGRAELWSMPITPQWRYESYETLPFSVRFDRSGRRLLVGGGGSTSGGAMLFDLKSRGPIRIFEGHNGVVVSAEFSPNERLILTASHDGTGGIWNIESGERLHRLQHNLNGVHEVATGASENRAVTITSPEIVADKDAAGLWDVETGQIVAWLNHAGFVWSTDIDPKAERVVTGGGDQQLKVWDVAGGQLLMTLPDYGAEVMSVAFSQDGQRILAAFRNSTIRIVDSRSGQLLSLLRDTGLGMVKRAVFSSDEHSIAVATESGDIWLWIPSESKTLVLKGHQQLVQRIEFSHDGELLVSGGLDGAVRVWSTRSGAELAVPLAFARQVDLDLHPETGQLAAAAWGEFAVADVGVESRTPEQIARVLACASPWALEAMSLSLIVTRPAEEGCF